MRHRRASSFALIVGSAVVLPAGLTVAALTLSAACGPSGGSGGNEAGSTPAPGAIFVIDSTNKLFSFDAQGNPLESVAVPSPIGALNGGGIALASGLLYVTIGESTNAISAYSLTLAPQILPAGSFSGLEVPRGIAFDSHNSQFYVGNGGPTLNTAGVYDANGMPVNATGGFPSSYGRSGVAYDPDDQTIWVANYTGFPPSGIPTYGVAEYTESGAAAQTFYYATQFVPEIPDLEPYSIAVCPSAATGGPTVVVVGFMVDDASQIGTHWVEAYTTSGVKLGVPSAGDLQGPYNMSCDPQGNVYVADKAGLFRGTVTSGGISEVNPVTAGFAGLTPPIYGVFARAGTGAPEGGVSNDGASGNDATIADGGDAGEEAGDDDASLCNGLPPPQMGGWVISEYDGAPICCNYVPMSGLCPGGLPMGYVQCYLQDVGNVDSTTVTEYYDTPAYFYGANPPASAPGLGICIQNGNPVDPATCGDVAICACPGIDDPGLCDPCPSPGCDDGGCACSP
jgi:hypothetical protein